VIRCLVPLEQMVGYSKVIRSLTSGSATFTLQFSHFSYLENIPKNL